jgi:hypothetical protein
MLLFSHKYVKKGGGAAERTELKSHRPESPKIKSADLMEQGQRILANIIAGSYLRTTKRGNYTESQHNVTKDKVLKK